MLIFVKNHKLRKEINVSMQGRVLLLQKVVTVRAESARRPPGCNWLLKKECRLSDRSESLELENPALPLSCFRAKCTQLHITSSQRWELWPPVCKCKYKYIYKFRYWVYTVHITQNLGEIRYWVAGLFTSSSSWIDRKSEFQSYHGSSSRLRWCRRIFFHCGQ